MPQRRSVSISQKLPLVRSIGAGSNGVSSCAMRSIISVLI
jgi:hypothetical protein